MTYATEQKPFVIRAALMNLCAAQLEFESEFECEVLESLPPFARSAAEADINACEDDAFETPLLSIISKHRRACWQSFDSSFVVDIEGMFRAAAHDAARAIVTAVEARSNVVTFPRS